MKNLSIADANYLAGLLDGEGCLGIRKHKLGYVHAVIEVCMTNRRPLDWACDVTGLGNVTSHIERRVGRRQPFKWVVTGVSNIQALLRVIEPYMRVKRAEAKALLILAYLREVKSRLTGPREYIVAEESLVRISKQL